MNENNSDEFTANFARLTQLLIDRCDQIEDRLNKGGIKPAVAKQNASERSLFEIKELTRDELGPLYQLLKDPTVGDILINSPKSVYIERKGKLEKVPVTFESNEQLLEIAVKIAHAAGKEFDLDRPYLDTRLIDGSRLNIVAPPLSLDGVSISIRKFPTTMITLDTLVEYGSMDQNIADFLKICARSRINTLVVGGTGSGKTTMLNCIAQHIAPDERIVTIEDAAELRLPIEHKVRLETKPKFADAPDYHEVTIRDLMINALRMRPDRIIVGETRGAEAFDMIQAMNTGHEGSMTTIHANSPRDALQRLESMINIAVPTMSSLGVKQRICSAIDLIVMVARMDDGSRKVLYVTEIVGMEGEIIATQDLFKFEEGVKDANGNVTGKFKQANIMPKFAKKCFKYGFQQQLNQIFAIGNPSQNVAPATTYTAPTPNNAPPGGFGFFGKSNK